MYYEVYASFWGGPSEFIAQADDYDEALVRKQEVERDAMGRRVEVWINECEELEYDQEIEMKKIVEQVSGEGLAYIHIEDGDYVANYYLVEAETDA